MNELTMKEMTRINEIRNSRAKLNPGRWMLVNDEDLQIEEKKDDLVDVHSLPFDLEIVATDKEKNYYVVNVGDNFPLTEGEETRDIHKARFISRSPDYIDYLLGVIDRLTKE